MSTRKLELQKKDRRFRSNNRENKTLPFDNKKLRILFIGIFFISFSLLALEIILTRILSVLLSHHYVFVVVSVALLGLGVGSVFVYFFRSKIPASHKRFGTLSFFASLFSVSIPFTVIILTRISSIETIHSKIFIHALLLFIPFFLAGMLLAEVFRIFPSQSAKLYGADLIGCAAGTLAVIPVLNRFGGLNSSFFIGLISSVGALLFAIAAIKKRKKRMRPALGVLAATACLFAINLADPFFRDTPIGMNPAKQSYVSLQNPSVEGNIVDTRWSAYGRTDLVKFNKRPEVMVIYIDGSAGSPMLKFNGNIAEPGSLIVGLKAATPGYFPFFFLKDIEKDNALIIGPGGGRDILLALMGSIRHITAVEINKNLIDIVREYAWFNGGIFTDFKNVDLVHAEGRNFLKRQKNKYDIIMLQFPYTEGSRSLEGYVLTENFLFTTNAMQDYMDHLTDEGSLVIACDQEVEVVRLVTTSLAVLNERGVNNTEALKQIFTLGSQNKKYLFVLRRRPFSAAEISPRYNLMKRFQYESAASFFPYIQGEFNPQIAALSKGDISLEEMQKIYEEKGYRVNPVSDNNPFFFNFSTRIPLPLPQILWAAVIMSLGITIVPPLYRKRKYIHGEGTARSKVFFVRLSLKLVILYTMLGCGFMLVEISLIQRFSLFLGQPVLSLTVLLFSILGSAGLGSLWSSRVVTKKINTAISVVSVSISTILIAYVFILPYLFDQLLGTGLVFRLIMTMLFLAVPGFLMGMPFPLGMQLLKERQMEDHIPWMWGINGVSSVLGAVITIVVAMSIGFSEALLIGAGCYLVIFLVFRLFRIKQES